MINKDTKVVYVRPKDFSKRNLFIEHLISQGIDVMTVEHTGEIRGMDIEYIIVDELVKEQL